MNSSDINEISSLLNSSDYNGSLFAGFMVLFALIMIIMLIAVIFKVISRWIFFKKCGEEGWKALIPIYTDITLLKVADVNWWWILLLYAGTLLSSINSFSNIVNELNGYQEAMALIGIIFAFLSLAGGVASLLTKINISYNLSKKFNKSSGYTVLILFFESIMFLVLGLTKSSVYDKDVVVSKNGIFKDK